MEGQKTGGRQKGTPNKSTLQHRQLLQTIFEHEIESGRIYEELAKLEGKDYLNFMLKLSAFIVPKPVPKDAEFDLSEYTRPLIIAPVGTKEEVERLRHDENLDLNGCSEAEMAKIFYYSDRKFAQQLKDANPLMDPPPQGPVRGIFPPSGENYKNHRDYKEYYEASD